ncbi:MAG: hypothetical protein NTU97_02720 [Candidatus Magasanikbacteria bacterium]|nr:hypothetical protein [Candidatus Magasanikbacteria bacterium]
MFLRPIIPGRNDGFENIRNIIDIAKDNKKKLAYGGFKEQGTRLKILKPEVENFIQSYCDQVGVKNYPKTSCAVSAITGKDCFTHVDSEPENLLVLDFFGYKFKKNSNGKIELKTGTLGDKNFIRFLTKSQPVIINLNTNSNIISSISTKKKKYEASSSWFLWSRNISSCLECDYCVIKGLEHLKDSLSVVGCNPVDLSNLKMKVR